MQNISFSTPDQVYFINYDEMDATQPEGTTIGWGATQVSRVSFYLMKNK